MGIFTPFRALGYITIDVPFSISKRGTSHFLTTCIDHSFQIYDLDKMSLLFVGPKTELSITAIASHNDFTFAACGNSIIAFKRAKEEFTLRQNNYNDDKMDLDSRHSFSIYELKILGDLILAVCDDNVIRIWNHITREFHNQILFGSTFQVTTVIHPSTYLNKILVASQEGKMQLWNINSMRCIYEFEKSFSSPITYICQSPVLDIVAIGTLNGKIAIHNIKLDKELMSFSQEGKVTAISFRSDEHQHMCSANMNGDVAIWDLDSKTLFHVIKGAHDGLIMSAQFINGQPLLVTGGGDNAVKQWIFDAIDGIPRILKFRSGHHSPPTFIRHYGNEGHNILSSGSDHSLRVFSVIRDSQNVELSQACTKEKDWDNILTCHAHDSEARTWNFSRKSIGKHKFKASDNSNLKAVAVSVCGNFGFIGSSKGVIDMYNMQSGIYKKKFVGHNKSITALFTDNISRRLFSSSLDGNLYVTIYMIFFNSICYLQIWDVDSGKVVEKMDLNSPISLMQLHSESGLLAVSTDDFCVRIIDTETIRIVREFWGHRNRVLDMCFSDDSRWLISTSLDGTIRTWDLPSGNLIDCFKAERVCTSVSFSPNGDFLATSHVDHVGIYLWANKTQYSNISIKPVDDSEIFDYKLPSVGGVDDFDNDGSLSEKEEELSFEHLKLHNEEDMVEEMIRLSNIPKSKWQNLLNLEIIKKRNKPKEVPKAPALAPFFLPTIAGPTPKFFDNSVDTAEEKTNKSSKIVKINDMEVVTEFTRLLRDCGQNNDFSPFFAFLKTLTPSEFDFEMQQLSENNEFCDFILFIESLKAQLITFKDFELVEAYMAVFLKIHAETLIKDPLAVKCVQSLNDFLNEHLESWKKLESLMQNGICLVDFVRYKI
ncbi:hypothetical protein HK099_001485 [Clydaea vesicula]|uniref:Small-subunit processome Utp21 domain-containing protein n=1 Tax=Clydaea vesicula TaxID=447962 RepID=A0AAD5U7Y6_9FUNG|nr:hypothetical protein HK099_001485 [Clydaea vesicula]